jgi:hypothetical protein
MNVLGSGELTVAVRHLHAAITKRFMAMKKRERIAAIRKLAGGSVEDKTFIRSAFPAFYREAFLAR